jgi:hypothetical protein
MQNAIKFYKYMYIYIALLAPMTRYPQKVITYIIGI